MDWLDPRYADLDQQRIPPGRVRKVIRPSRMNPRAKFGQVVEPMMNNALGQCSTQAPYSAKGADQNVAT